MTIQRLHCCEVFALFLIAVGVNQNPYLKGIAIGMFVFFYLYAMLGFF